jgi:hypothetical protein
VYIIKDCKIAYSLGTKAELLEDTSDLALGIFTAQALVLID